MTRAWFVAHRGRPALIAAVATGILLAAFGATSISVWGSVRQIPLWAFVPGTLVMVAGTTWDGRLDAWPAVEQRRVRLARASWVAAVLAATTVAAVPAAVVLDNPALVVTTSVLLVAAFGPALVDVRMTIVVGGGCDMAAWLLASRLRETDNARALFLETLPGSAWWALLGVGSLGIASYVVRGPRKLGRRAVPG